MDLVESRSSVAGMKTGLATQTAQKDQFRTRIVMTAAVQLVEAVPQIGRQTLSKLNALRCEIQQLQECVNAQGAERNL